MSYIERETLIKSIEKRRLVFKDGITVAEALAAQGKVIREEIENAPAADVVAVVRCGECKRWKADGGYGLDLDGTKRLYGKCAITNMAIKENCFCNFGARKDGERSEK